LALVGLFDFHSFLGSNPSLFLKSLWCVKRAWKRTHAFKCALPFLHAKCTLTSTTIVPEDLKQMSNYKKLK